MKPLLGPPGSAPLRRTLRSDGAERPHISHGCVPDELRPPLRQHIRQKHRLMVSTHRDLRRSTVHQAKGGPLEPEGQGRSQKLPSVHEVAPALGQQFCQLDCIRVVGQPSLRSTHALGLALPYATITLPARTEELNDFSKAIIPILLTDTIILAWGWAEKISFSHLQSHDVKE